MLNKSEILQNFVKIVILKKEKLKASTIVDKNIMNLRIFIYHDEKFEKEHTQNGQGKTTKNNIFKDFHFMIIFP